MDNIKTQATTLIAQAPVTEDVKQGLLQKLEQEGVTDDLMVEISVAVGEAQAKLNRDNKAQLDQLSELDKQEEAEQAQAFADFEKEMAELEEDADNLVKAVNAGQNESEIEEQRKKIAEL
jgi:hypothetical protein